MTKLKMKTGLKKPVTSKKSTSGKAINRFKKAKKSTMKRIYDKRAEQTKHSSKGRSIFNVKLMDNYLR